MQSYDCMEKNLYLHLLHSDERHKIFLHIIEHIEARGRLQLSIIIDSIVYKTTLRQTISPFGVKILVVSKMGSWIARPIFGVTHFMSVIQPPTKPAISVGPKFATRQKMWRSHSTIVTLNQMKNVTKFSPFLPFAALPKRNHYMLK